MHLKPTLTKRKAMLQAVVLSLYPLHWFFTFLYYTDVAAVTTVLAMYLASLKKNYWFSALIGALAVVIRQTNIIWVFLVACTGIINISVTHGKQNTKSIKSDVSAKHGLEYATGINTEGFNLRKRKIVKSGKTIEHSSSRKTRSKIWVLAYFLATAAVLVPAPLIEFRYYTIPFYFLVLHCDNSDDQSWILTGILYIGVNIFTMAMFLFRPFHWAHEPGIQRFIW
ncbi:hypothetical protein V8G54_019472 [Vigna mungo]|uniref:Dol-P-Glc:Glc(2)Man(9)GlcNAc(2)-PP-Dol alpha-1,2-glucosyltransferase n=1 Tax=Vigna mungo TaxID=3915 RepID=A0AAQ3NC08_VIGMU